MEFNRPVKSLSDVVTAGVSPRNRFDATSELNKIKETLAVHKFPLDEYTPIAIRAIPMPVDKYLQKVRIFTAVEDELRRSVMMQCGVRRDFFREARNCVPATFLNFCNYLRSPLGQKDVRDGHNRLKLEQKATDNCRAEDVALLALFNHQRFDLAQYQMAIRAEWEKKRAELLEKLRALDDKYERKLARLKRKCQPAGQYEEPSEVELMRECWRYYTTHCLNRGAAAPQRTDEELNFAFSSYSAMVKEDHVVNFIRKDPIKKMLQDWGDQKVTKDSNRKINYGLKS